MLVFSVHMLYSGLAISTNNGLDFVRLSKAPIVERTSESPYSNAAPFVLKVGNHYKMWFWEGEAWLNINGKDYIRAVISYAESLDGINWNTKMHGCIKPQIENNEFSVGRPWIVFHDNKYKMFYSLRYVDKLYRIKYAESSDGINWLCKDVDFDVSSLGWDSEMICYSSIISVYNRLFLFYNGNNNGESGFGYAEITDF